jgi:hypothetical protein
MGYAGRGAVFLLLGISAALSVSGVGWQPLGTTEVLFILPKFPMGWVSLIIIGLGLLCFATYRATDAIFDIHKYGRDLKGILRRSALGVSGICYAGFAAVAASVIFGWGVNRSSDQSVRDWTAWIMSFPAGDWLVGIVGIIIVATGVGLGITATRASFSQRVRFHENEKPVALLLGRIGLLARSMIMLLIGGFLIFAATTHNAQHAEGFAGALRILKQQAFGSLLLGMTAVGMLCFGAFGVGEAFRAEVPKLSRRTD